MIPADHALLIHINNTTLSVGFAIDLLEVFQVQSIMGGYLRRGLQQLAACRSGTSQPYQLPACA
jgi:hypothetical protein